MNIYIIIGSMVILIFLLIFAFILHNARVPSTKATDYFKNLDSENTEEDNSELAEGNADEVVIIEEKDDPDQDIKAEQTAKYLRLLEMHRNNKYKKEIQKSIDAIDEDNFDALNDYISIAELSALLGFSTNETISFLTSLGLIDSEYNTIVLTDMGVDIGGQYNNHEDITWVEFPKDIINRLGNTYKKEPKRELTKKKKDTENHIIFIIIVVALVYIFFFS